MVKRHAKIFLALAIVLSMSSPVLAREKKQDFPNRPIRFIVPYVAGGGNDVQSRGIAPYLEKHLGVRVVIYDRPGADGRIGVNEAWKSAPDGYTLVNSGWPTPIINQMLFSVNYKYREFTHLFAWSKDNIVLVVNAESWQTFGEFMADAQTRTLTCGISGIGSLTTIAGLALEEAAKLKTVNWVPYSSGGESVIALAGKHIDFGLTTMASAFSLASAGKLRPLLVFSDEKDPRFPNTPLPREVGLNLTPLATMWSAMAPPGLPPKVAQTLEQAFSKAVKEPDYLAWAKNARIQISPIGSEKFLAQTLATEKEIVKHLDKIKAKFK